MLQTESQESMITKKISIKKKLSTLYQDNKKDVLRASQESGRSIFASSQVQKWKTLLWEEIPPRHLENWFQDSFHHAQLFRHLKISAAMIEGGLTTA